jgi:hypothetical protein
MGLLEQAINDAATFTSNDSEFGISIALNKDSFNANVKGYATKTHLKLHTPNGYEANTKYSSVVISEKNILADSPNYPVRLNTEVNMINHLVNVADSTGVTRYYIVLENFPDETLGLITLVLGDYYD